MQGKNREKKVYTILYSFCFVLDIQEILGDVVQKGNGYDTYTSRSIYFFLNSPEEM